MINGNDIIDPQGTRVWFDVYVGGWAPALLSSPQIDIDTDGFASGTGAPLEFPFEPCDPPTVNGSPHCEARFGLHSECNESSPNFCSPVFLDESRLGSPFDTWVWARTFPFGLIQFGFLVPPFTEYAEDLGESYLFGSFAVDVPQGAMGTYTIYPTIGGPSFVVLDGELIPFDQVIPAVVTISETSPCCLSGGVRTSMLVNDCVASGAESSLCFGGRHDDGVDDGRRRAEHNGTASV